MGNPTHKLHTFTLLDRWGETHNYDMTFTPSGEGLGISMFFAGSAALPLTRAIGQVTKARTLVSWYFGLDDDDDGDQPEEQEENYDVDPAAKVGSAVVVKPKGGTERAIPTDILFDGLQELHLEEFGLDLQTLLCDPQSPKLIKQVLRYTIRDNNSLGDKNNFDVAFRGNYVEAGKAALEVIKANGFLPQLDIFKSVEGLIKGQAPTAPSTSQQSEQPSSV